MREQAPQRRLAALLAADVVGYSRMMQVDEAGTLAALKSRRTEILQPLVSKLHGRIIKVMGDGVLVEFASAVEAVSCAVALQEAMAAANETAGPAREYRRAGRYLCLRQSPRGSRGQGVMRICRPRRDRR